MLFFGVEMKEKEEKTEIQLYIIFCCVFLLKLKQKKMHKKNKENKEKNVTLKYM